MVDIMQQGDEVLSDKLSPRSAAQTLVNYQENHQIELFMQEMLSVVFAILPEDPFEYMTYHIAAHRPAAPPAPDDAICGTAALWVLLPGGDPLCAEHWRLRRCWLTSGGTFCISSAASQVTKSQDGLLISAPTDIKPMTIPVGSGCATEVLSEEESARPFALKLTPNPESAIPSHRLLQLAAGSEEQRDEWLSLFRHFANPLKREGPPPVSARMLSARAVESQLPFGTFNPINSANEVPGPSGTPVADPITVDSPIKPAPSPAANPSLVRNFCQKSDRLLRQHGQRHLHLLPSPSCQRSMCQALRQCHHARRKRHRKES